MHPGFRGHLVLLLVLQVACHGWAASSTNLEAELLIAGQLFAQCGSSQQGLNCSSVGVTCEPCEPSSKTVGCLAGETTHVVGLKATRGVTTGTGVVPGTISQLGALTSLQLSACQLRGELPASMAALTSLSVLDLSANQLTGSLPAWVAELPKLQVLNISYNGFAGKVPAGWCSAGNSSQQTGGVKSLTVALDHNPLLQGVVPTCLVWPPPSIVNSVASTGLTWPMLGTGQQAATPSDGGDDSSADELRTTLAWSLPVSAVVCFSLGAACSLLVLRRRQDRQKKQERQRQQEHKQLKQLMYALADIGTGPLQQAPTAGPQASGLCSAPTLPDRVPSMYGAGSTLGAVTSIRDVGQQAWATSKAFAFVVTDIEGSTQLSAAAGQSLFARLQEIHDNVMRELIAKHGGLEVGTEGDSFTVAFTAVAPAVAFCMDVQYKLLDTAWPPACLKLGPCKPVSSPDGQLLLAGPRVRMGVHWAGEGSVAHRLHQLTKQRMFEGPGLQTAQEVGDAAYGGQVLLSHDAWVCLRGSMASAGFPVIRCLGMYQLETLAAPTWLYHATEMVGKPLGRGFGVPRGVRQLWAPALILAGPHPGAETPSARPSVLTSVLTSFSMAPTPSRSSQPGMSQSLPSRFLAPTWDLHCMPPPGIQPLACSADSPLTFVIARLDCTAARRAGRKLPLSLASRLDEVLATQAQQFRGYVVDGQQGSGGLNTAPAVGVAPSGGWSSMTPRMLGLAISALTPRSAAQNAFFGSQAPACHSLTGTGSSAVVSGNLATVCGVWQIVFESATDALRFCHAAQMSLMYSRCPADCASWLGEDVFGPDGRALFQGPRMSMAIHTTHEYEVTLVPGNQPSPELSATYGGSGPQMAAALASCLHGGQVVLTESAWEHVKPSMVSHPGAVVALSLGSHVTAQSWPTPQHLMEVLPNLLARRTFPSLTTHMQTQPGYRDAPGVDKPLAIVFVKVQKPAAVLRAQQQGGSQSQALDMPDDEVLSTIMAYQLAVNSYVAVARQMLAAYGGYECKEPEPGKFTLAFQRLDQAIGWAAQLQHELLNIKWPAALASWPDCVQEYSEEDNTLLWSGLRVRVGMAYGFISSKKPLNTGRADYFGVLANTAARVCSLAAPGQVLVDCSDPKAQPLGADSQPLLREAGVTCLGLRWAPVVHDTEAHSRSASIDNSNGGSPRAVGQGLSSLLPPITTPPIITLPPDTLSITTESPWARTLTDPLGTPRGGTTFLQLSLPPVRAAVAAPTDVSGGSGELQGRLKPLPALAAVAAAVSPIAGTSSSKLHRLSRLAPAVGSNGGTDLTSSAGGVEAASAPNSQDTGGRARYDSLLISCETNATDKLMPLPAERWQATSPTAQAPGMQQQQQPGAPPAGMSARPSATSPITTPRSTQLNTGGGPASPASARAPPAAPAPAAFDDEVELRPLGWFLLRGLHQPKLIYQAQPASLARRSYKRPTGAVAASPPGLSRGGAPSALSGSRTNSRTRMGSLRNLLGRALGGGPAVLLPSECNSVMGLADMPLDSQTTDQLDVSRASQPEALALMRGGSGPHTYAKSRTDAGLPGGRGLSQQSLESGASAPHHALQQRQVQAVQVKDRLQRQVAGTGGPRLPTVTMQIGASDGQEGAETAHSDSGRLSGLRVLASRALQAASTWMGASSSTPDQPRSSSSWQLQGPSSMPASHQLAMQWGPYAASSYSTASIQYGSQPSSVMQLGGSRHIPPDMWNSLNGSSLGSGGHPMAAPPMPRHGSSMAGMPGAPGPHSHPHHTPLLPAVAAAVAAAAAAAGRRGRNMSSRPAVATRLQASSSGGHGTSSMSGNVPGISNSGAPKAAGPASSSQPEHPSSDPMVYSTRYPASLLQTAALPSTETQLSGSRDVELGSAPDYLPSSSHGPQQWQEWPAQAADTDTRNHMFASAVLSTQPGQGVQTLGEVAGVVPSGRDSPCPSHHSSIRITRDQVHALTAVEQSLLPMPPSAGGALQWPMLPAERAGSSALTDAQHSPGWTAAQVADELPLPVLPRLRKALSRHVLDPDVTTPPHHSDASSHATTFSSPLPAEHQPQPSPAVHTMDLTHSSGTGSPSPDGMSRGQYGMLGMQRTSTSPTQSNSSAMLSRLLRKPKRLLSSKDVTSGPRMTTARSAVNLMQRLLHPHRTREQSAAATGSPQQGSTDADLEQGLPSPERRPQRADWHQLPQQMMPIQRSLDEAAAGTVLQGGTAVPPGCSLSSNGDSPATRTRRTYAGPSSITLPHDPQPGGVIPVTHPVIDGFPLPLPQLSDSQALLGDQSSARFYHSVTLPSLALPSSSSSSVIQVQQNHASGLASMGSSMPGVMLAQSSLAHIGPGPSTLTISTPGGGAVAAPSQAVFRRSRTSLPHSESGGGTAQRAQREYAAEVAATYLVARHQLKLSGWGSQALPIEPTAGPDLVPGGPSFLAPGLQGSTTQHAGRPPQLPPAPSAPNLADYGTISQQATCHTSNTMLSPPTSLPPHSTSPGPHGAPHGGPDTGQQEGGTTGLLSQLQEHTGTLPSIPARLERVESWLADCLVEAPWPQGEAGPLQPQPH